MSLSYECFSYLPPNLTYFAFPHNARQGEKLKKFPESLEVLNLDFSTGYRNDILEQLPSSLKVLLLSGLNPWNSRSFKIIRRKCPKVEVVYISGLKHNDEKPYLTNQPLVETDKASMLRYLKTTKFIKILEYF